MFLTKKTYFQQINEKRLVMNHLNAINLRQSARTYTDEIIDSNIENHLKGYIDWINEESGLTITWIKDGSRAFNGLSKSYGIFKGVHSIIALKGPSTLTHLKEKIGYYGEKIVLEATTKNLSTCWVAGTFDPDSLPINLDNDETLVCVVTIGHTPSKKGFRDRFIYSMSHRKTLPIDSFYTSDSDVPLWFEKGIEAIAKAPSAMNKQPVRCSYNKDRVTIAVEKESQLVDLGIAKYHFELATHGQFTLGNPGNYITMTS